MLVLVCQQKVEVLQNRLIIVNSYFESRHFCDPEMTLYVTDDDILLIGHFSCHNCDKTFSRQDTLKIHELKAHVNQVGSATKKKPAASDVKPGGTNKRTSTQTARDNNRYSSSSDDEEIIPKNPSKSTPSANNTRFGQRLKVAILLAFCNQGLLKSRFVSIGLDKVVNFIAHLTMSLYP